MGKIKSKVKTFSNNTVVNTYIILKISTSLSLDKHGHFIIFIRVTFLYATLIMIDHTLSIRGSKLNSLCNNHEKEMIILTA